MLFRTRVLALLVVAGAAAQQHASAEPTVFADITKSAGVTFNTRSSHTSQKYLVETMVGGVAVLDYDADGRLDIFFVNGAALKDPMPAGAVPDKSDPIYWNRLYRSNPDGTFTDVTNEAGVAGHSYGQGTAAADFDNDGWCDLYVTNFGRNILYRNNGNGTFTDVTNKAGVGAGGWSASALFLDYDRDGWLDLLVVRYLQWDFSKNIRCGERSAAGRSFCHPNEFKSITHVLYRNNHDGTFTDVTAEAGLGDAAGNGLGSDFNDFDHDGWPDILVANDAAPQQLFRNKGDGTFEDVALTTGLAYDEEGRMFSGMGTNFEDYDNDGWPDVFIGDLAHQKYALFRNAKGAFTYHTGPSNIGIITQLHSGWGTRFVDFDNDGWKDLFVAQSHVMDDIDVVQPPVRYLETLLMLRNVGGRFEDISERSGEPFRTRLAARGTAFGDLDNNGFIDLVVNCNEGPALVLKNLGNQSHWLIINLVGTASNRDGIGAQLKLVTGSGIEQYRTVSTGGSYFSASDKRVHFGLGKEKTAALLEVTWPSGVVQRLENVQADQVLTVREATKSSPPTVQRGAGE